MFINFTNHPSSVWENSQIEAAKVFGPIVDMQFPPIDEYGDEQYIAGLVSQYVSMIKDLSPISEDTIVHIMGEMTFTCAMVNKLQQNGYICVASTTGRNVTLLDDGSKKVIFQFIRFRRYL